MDFSSQCQPSAQQRSNTPLSVTSGLLQTPDTPPQVTVAKSVSRIHYHGLPITNNPGCSIDGNLSSTTAVSSCQPTDFPHQQGTSQSSSSSPAKPPNLASQPLLNDEDTCLDFLNTEQYSELSTPEGTGMEHSKADSDEAEVMSMVFVNSKFAAQQQVSTEFGSKEQDALPSRNHRGSWRRPYRRSNRMQHQQSRTDFEKAEELERINEFDGTGNYYVTDKHRFGRRGQRGRGQSYMAGTRPDVDRSETETPQEILETSDDIAPVKFSKNSSVQHRCLSNRRGQRGRGHGPSYMEQTPPERFELKTSEDLTSITHDSDSSEVSENNYSMQHGSRSNRRRQRGRGREHEYMERTPQVRFETKTQQDRESLSEDSESIKFSGKNSISNRYQNNSFGQRGGGRGQGYMEPTPMERLETKTLENTERDNDNSLFVEFSGNNSNRNDRRGQRGRGRGRGQGYVERTPLERFATKTPEDVTRENEDSNCVEFLGNNSVRSKSQNNRRGQRGRGRGHVRCMETKLKESVEADAAADVNDAMPMEEELVNLIVTAHKAVCRLSDLKEQFSFSSPYKLVEMLSQYRRLKIYKNSEDIWKSIIFVYIRQLQLCAHVSGRAGCRNPKCRYIHVCRSYVADCCTRADQCKCSHDLSGVFQQVDLRTNWDPEAVLPLLKTSNLIICAGHNDLHGQKCEDPNSCLRLHVCNHFVQNRCLNTSETCRYGHDLQEGRNRELLCLFEKFGMLESRKDFLMKLIIPITHERRAIPPNQERPQSVRTGAFRKESDPDVFSTHSAEISAKHKVLDEVRPIQTSETQVLSKWKPSETRTKGADNFKTEDQESLFCVSYEDHECHGMQHCSERHSHMAYLWRINHHQKWVSLSDPMSRAVEMAYCNPSKMNSIIQFQGSDIVINFKSMTHSFGRVQRLSTPSYVISRKTIDATRWRWYWNNGSEYSMDWKPFEDDQPPYQDVLESKFLADSNQICCFETSEWQYEIDFRSMMQTNMRTGKRRAVCRRPKVLSDFVDDIMQVQFYYNEEKLPPNQSWMPMDTETPGWTDLVMLNTNTGTYADVARQFHSTLSESDYKILRIFAIQNLDLWQKFETQKTKMEKRAKTSVEMRTLFHGTADERTVRCICYQNFDPRMHGKNATAYGKGAYFSATAKYSHGYTTLEESTGRRFMFLASVLIGQCTLGKSEYQRPPPINPNKIHGDLFDTCVNNLMCPTIFVIFDNVQCYPSYLIEYKEVFESAAVASVPHRTGLRSSYSLPSQNPGGGNAVNPQQYYTHPASHPLQPAATTGNTATSVGASAPLRSILRSSQSPYSQNQSGGSVVSSPPYYSQPAGSAPRHVNPGNTPAASAAAQSPVFPTTQPSNPPRPSVPTTSKQQRGCIVM